MSAMSSDLSVTWQRLGRRRTKLGVSLCENIDFETKNLVAVLVKGFVPTANNAPFASDYPLGLVDDLVGVGNRVARPYGFKPL